MGRRPGMGEWLVIHVRGNSSNVVAKNLARAAERAAARHAAARTDLTGVAARLEFGWRGTQQVARVVARPEPKN